LPQAGSRDSCDGRACIAAIAQLRAGTEELERRELFAVGAVLLFASDLAAARDKSVAKEVLDRAWGRSTN